MMRGMSVLPESLSSTPLVALAQADRKGTQPGATRQRLHQLQRSSRDHLWISAEASGIKRLQEAARNGQGIALQPSQDMPSCQREFVLSRSQRNAKRKATVCTPAMCKSSASDLSMRVCYFEHLMRPQMPATMLFAAGLC